MQSVFPSQSSSFSLLHISGSGCFWKHSLQLLFMHIFVPGPHPVPMHSFISLFVQFSSSVQFAV